MGFVENFLGTINQRSKEKGVNEIHLAIVPLQQRPIEVDDDEEDEGNWLVFTQKNRAVSELGRDSKRSRVRDKPPRQSNRSRKEVINSQALPSQPNQVHSAQLPRDRTNLPPLTPSNIVLTVCSSSLSEDVCVQLEADNKFFSKRINSKYEDMGKKSSLLSTTRGATFFDAAKLNEPLLAIDTKKWPAPAR
uniref:Uncharacterized protein n=1 Tax=Cannabis sativa TaxID=3483 RepID=A0A803NJJ2_CANSA